MKTTIVLTGGSGLLAVNWAVQMREHYNVVLLLHERTLELPNVTSIKADLDSIEDIIGVLESVKAVILIHTAGLTNVEGCEQNPTLAHQVNVLLTQNIAKAAATLGIRMIHISTDHLYDGNSAYTTEDKVTNPLNVYGETKALAESVVAETNPGALIIRTNFYGWGPSYRKSFSDMIINSLRENKKVTLYSNVYYTPVYVVTLILFVHKLLERSTKGIFNVVSDERVSKYHFGMLLAKAFGLKTELVLKGFLDQHAAIVTRPLDMSLSNGKLVTEVDIKLPGIDEQIELMKRQECDTSIIEIQNL